MKIRILEVASGNFVNGEIRLGNKSEMPSMQTGWIFNFDKHIKISNSKTYVLVSDKTPNIIEGCLVFEMKNKILPYMAYIEIAPHNKNKERLYDYIAGCLIAFACELSFTHGKGENRGFLTFDVREENESHQKKLMQVYAQKYKAKWLSFLSPPTTMIITPHDGEILIKEYLKQ